MIDSTYEDKLYQTPKFAGAFRYNTLKNCATRVCRACLDEITCVAVIVSDAANMSRHGSTLCSPTVEKILCRSPISQRSHVGNLRQTLSRERGEFTRGWKPQVSTLLPCRGARRIPASQAQLPAEVQRKTLRPLGTNTLTQFAHPAQPVQRKNAEETLCVSH